jgi:hypothetical protein
VSADIDAVSNRADTLATLVPVTIGVLVVGWAAVIWIRARRHSRDRHDTRL